MRAVLCLLLMVCLAAPATAGEYSRAQYPHWLDADQDCQNTRQEVLIARSLRPVLLDARGCRVISGLWRDVYSGLFHRNPQSLDIDHFVPLAEAHRSGAANWSRAKKAAFANDPGNLIITARQINRAKADQDPALWLPPNRAFRCIYARRWVAVKARWQLRMDIKEAAAIKRVLMACR